MKRTSLILVIAALLTSALFSQNVEIADTIPPKITIISPVPDSLYIVNFYNPEVHVQVEDPNLKGSQLILDPGLLWVYFGNEIKFTMENIPSIGQGKLKVKAEDMAGNVAEDSVTFNWTHLDVEGLAPPRNLEATNVSENSIDLNWDYNEDGFCINPHYLIFVDDRLVDTSFSTSYTLSQCTAGTTYSIAVAARISCWRESYMQSYKSDTIQVTTLGQAIGLDEIKTGLSRKVQIFPNPVYDKFKIKINQEERYLIKISDLNGKIIYNEEVRGLTHQIDLSSFQKGVYFVIIKSRDYVRTEKIIKL